MSNDVPRTVPLVASTSEAQRLRAARVLADLTVEQLAAQIDTKGLGAKTLGAVERGERSLRRHEIEIIAEATGVPEWFLSDGFEEPARDPVLAERVEALEGQMRAVLDIAFNRVGADLARAASHREADEGTVGDQGKGRPGQRRRSGDR